MRHSHDKSKAFCENITHTDSWSHISLIVSQIILWNRRALFKASLSTELSPTAPTQMSCYHTEFFFFFLGDCYFTLISLCGYRARWGSESVQADLYRETADQPGFANTTVLRAELFQNCSCSNMIFPSEERSFHNDTSLFFSFFFLQEVGEEKPRDCRSKCEQHAVHMLHQHVYRR